ncbi:hypothetical protein D3C79_480990 [compost metagenome]
MALLADAAQVQVRGVDVAVALDQLLQVAFGFIPVLVFQAHQGQRIAQLVVLGVLLDQAEELALGIGDAVLFDQGAGVGQAQALVVRVVANRPAQQWQGLRAAVQGLQQARAQQDWGDFAVLRRVRFEQLQGFFGLAVLVQQQGLAEHQLTVVRVLHQQAFETLQQAVAGALVGFGGGQGEEIEMGVALALQDLFHVRHGVVIAAGAGQLDGGGALGVEVLRVVAGPDQGVVQCRFVGAEVFGNAVGALGNPGVLGFRGLVGVVGQGDVEAVALAGQLRHQQAIERVLLERAIHHGLFRLALAGFGDGRLGLLRGQALAALEQGEGKQQCVWFVHRRL